LIFSDPTNTACVSNWLMARLILTCILCAALAIRERKQHQCKPALSRRKRRQFGDALYTRSMPWFGDSLGDPHHRDDGYRSDDAQHMARQVVDMISRGRRGTIIDWYGSDSGLKNQSTILLMKEAERESNFGFAVSEDAGAIRDCAQRRLRPR
jgi:hypothetical protein